MRIWLVLAAMAWGGTAAAQNAAPPVPEEDSIHVPDLRALRVRPDPEVAELARRLAEATWEPEIQAALSQRLADPKAEPRPPEGFGPRDLAPPIVARGALPRLSDEEMRRSFEIHRRVMDRIAAYYAAVYDLGELRQLVAFFESPVGRKYRERRPDMIAHILAWMDGPEFERELREVICRKADPEGPKDGPDHGYVRLFPEQDPSGAGEPDSRCRDPEAR
jgi:hypothetical protein